MRPGAHIAGPFGRPARRPDCKSTFYGKADPLTDDTQRGQTSIRPRRAIAQRRPPKRHAPPSFIALLLRQVQGDARYRRLPATARLALATAITDNADANGYWRLTYRHWGEAIGRGHRAVMRAVQAIETTGLIVVGEHIAENRQGANDYWVDPAIVARAQAAAGLPPTRAHAGGGCRR